MACQRRFRYRAMTDPKDDPGGMQIVHIADITMFYAPASGGVRTYLDAKHHRLDALQGVRHSLLIPGASARHEGGVYHVPALPLPFGKGYRFPVRLAPWCNTLRTLKPDLIEVGDPYLTAWAALEARRQLDVPVIGFYHSDLPLLVSNRMGNWFTPNVEAYVSKLYGNFDRVLAPSKVMADKLRRLGVRDVHVQPLGVDLETFNPARRDPQVRAELGIADTCRLLMASADLLVHAGDQETFGLVILEAMASGTPVVAVRAGAFGEIVNDQCGRLCQPNDARAMALAVREAFEAGARKLGAQARRHVEQHYSWDNVVNGLLEHYQAVLGHQQQVRAHA